MPDTARRRRPRRSGRTTRYVICRSRISSRASRPECGLNRQHQGAVSVPAGMSQPGHDDHQGEHQRGHAQQRHRTDQRSAAGGAAQNHHTLVEAAHPLRGVGQRGGFDLHGRQRLRFGQGPFAQAAAGRDLRLPHRLRSACWPEGADGTGRHAQGCGLQAAPTEIDGFSLLADVRCDADERQSLEQLCRYRGTSSEGLVMDRTGRFRAAISEPRMSVQGRQRQCGRIYS